MNFHTVLSQSSNLAFLDIIAIEMHAESYNNLSDR